MKFLIILFSLLPLLIFGQKQKNNYWLARTPNSTSYIQLKKGNHAIWFQHDCIHQSKKKGSWYYNSDTLHIIIDSDTSRFLKIENKLCYIDKKNKVTKLIYCIPKTKYRSYFRVKIRGRKLVKNT